MFAKQQQLTHYGIVLRLHKLLFKKLRTLCRNLNEWMSMLILHKLKRISQIFPKQRHLLQALIIFSLLWTKKHNNLQASVILVAIAVNCT